MNGTINMYDLFHPGGKAHLWGWIICIGTIILLIVTIIDICINIQKKKSDVNQELKFKELENNLRRVMGENYQKI